MKALINIFLTVSVMASLFSACEMKEEPLFPAADNLFSTVEGANTVLNGCYSGMASFNYYGADFMHLTAFSSGLYNTNRDASLKDIVAFNTTPSLNFVENVWRSHYQVIARANDVIDNLKVLSLPEEKEQDYIAGQAYFIRALTYFNLVRLYGGVPLLDATVNIETLNRPRASADDVYELIISDLEYASEKLDASQASGRPNGGAANMLLAKVYMTLAGNKNAGETPYWQKAYDAAIKVYGNYSLVSDYRTLWFESTSNNTEESIFEIQGNEENTLRLHQLFTASNGNIGRSVWGRIKPNVECYDLHAGHYPGDPRLTATFRTEFQKFLANGNTQQVETYPLVSIRNNKDKSYPWLDKYYMKDIFKSNYNTNMNFVVLRYADLLLMLGEIENELNGPDNAYQYVNEVLQRARLSSDITSSEPANWSGLTQEQFRDSIMFEYRFELLGEGHDWFNVRRRGYDHFKTNVIDIHNNTAAYDFTKNRDVELPDDARNMLIPIPQAEMTANPNISAEDQNPGY